MMQNFLNFHTNICLSNYVWYVCIYLQKNGHSQTDTCSAKHTEMSSIDRQEHLYQRFTSLLDKNLPKVWLFQLFTFDRFGRWQLGAAQKIIEKVVKEVAVKDRQSPRLTSKSM